MSSASASKSQTQVHTQKDSVLHRDQDQDPNQDLGHFIHIDVCSHPPVASSSSSTSSTKVALVSKKKQNKRKKHAAEPITNPSPRVSSTTTTTTTTAPRKTSLTAIPEALPSSSSGRISRKKQRQHTLQNWQDDAAQRIAYLQTFHASAAQLDRNTQTQSLIPSSHDSTHLFVSSHTEGKDPLTRHSSCCPFAACGIHPRWITAITQNVHCGLHLTQPTLIQQVTWTHMLSRQAQQASPRPHFFVQSETGTFVFELVESALAKTIVLNVSRCFESLLCFATFYVQRKWKNTGLSATHSTISAFLATTPHHA